MVLIASVPLLAPPRDVAVACALTLHADASVLLALGASKADRPTVPLCCQVGPIPADTEGSTAAVKGWLDAGAETVVLCGPRSAVTDLASEFPRERLVVLLSAEDATAAGAGDVAAGAWVKEAGAMASGVVAPFTTLPGAEDAALGTLRKLLGHKDKTQLVVSVAALDDASAVGALHPLGVDVATGAVKASAAAGEGAAAAGGGDTEPINVEHVGKAVVSCLRTDRPDGLFATVVCDESEAALGLVYSSAESVRESIRCGRGVYYSRSRGGLWRKGDTSGCYQDLVRVRMDCDADALQFIVRQNGSPPAFCHLQRRSCWGKSEGLRHLEIVLNERKDTATEGSYTHRLYNDAALLRHKLLEEAQELAEAETTDHIAAETADVMYFAMVALVRGGGSLADVERHLNYRSQKVTRRPGNAKAERIAAAEKHFAESAAKKQKKEE